MRAYFLIAALLATPAHAIVTPSERLLDAARDGNAQAAEAALKAGADINAANPRGHTPFILATYYGNTELLPLLVKAGAEPCAVDERGSNAYMGVAYKGHTDTARWLLKHTQCDVNLQNYAGQTALMMAALFGRETIIDLYLKAGARPDLTDAQGNSAATLAEGQGLSKLAKKLRFVMQ